MPPANAIVKRLSDEGNRQKSTVREDLAPSLNQVNHKIEVQNENRTTRKKTKGKNLHTGEARFRGCRLDYPCARVGQLTVTMLMRNTVSAVERQKERYKKAMYI